MSVISLKMEVFQKVEKKLCGFGLCGPVDQEHNTDFAWKVFGMDDIFNPDFNDAVAAKIREWVTLGYTYNQLSYAYRYGNPYKPDDYREGNPESVSDITIMQAYTYISCILYNSDVDSYVSKELYDMMVDEHKAWTRTGEDILNFLAHHIVEHSPEYICCSWCD